MKQLVLICLIMLVTSCAAIKGETAQQRLYGAISDYTSLQKASLVYKADCNSRPLLLKNGCEAHVKVIQKYNNKANGLIQAVSIKEDGMEYIGTISSALVVVVGELSSYLIKIGDGS